MRGLGVGVLVARQLGWHAGGEERPDGARAHSDVTR